MDEEINPWKIRAARLVYDNPWISLTEYSVINPAGNHGIYGKVHYKNIAVGVIPMDEAGNVWLVGQYRFTLEQYSWEIPEGGCPYDEAPEQAALRELREETGLIAGHLKKILTLHLSNSVSDEIAHIYLATELVAAEASPEETEQLQVCKKPLEEVYRMVLNGEITDSMTVAGIMRLKLYLAEEAS